MTVCHAQDIAILAIMAVTNASAITQLLLRHFYFGLKLSSMTSHSLNHERHRN